MKSLLSDLEILIAEIENNPRLSSWVVRMALKSIKDKAEKMAAPSDLQPANLSERACAN